MTQTLIPQDEVHDFLFLDIVQRGIKQGVMFDFHTRPADTKEIEEAFLKFVSAEVSEFRAGVNIIVPTVGNRWLHTSNMQKAVRRSNVLQAMKSSLWLIQNGFEEQFWRRLACVAGEDVALGEPYLTAITMWVCRSKTLRARLGPNLLPWLMSWLCSPKVPKSRDLTDPFVCSIVKGSPIWPKYEQLANDLDEHAIIKLATDEGADPGDRMAALWCFYPRYLIVEDKHYSAGLPSASRAVLMDEWCMPGLMAYLFHWSQTASGYGLGVPVPLVWERMCKAGWAKQTQDPYLITDSQVQFEQLPNMHGMYASAMDMHTRPGKAAIAYFRKASDLIREHPLQALADMKNQPPTPAGLRGAINEAVFYAEVGLLVPRLSYEGWPLWFSLYRDSYFEWSYGLDAPQSRGLIMDVQSQLPVLNKARLKILQSTREEEGW